MSPMSLMQLLLTVAEVMPKYRDLSIPDMMNSTVKEPLAALDRAIQAKDGDQFSAARDVGEVQQHSPTSVTAADRPRSWSAPADRAIPPVPCRDPGRSFLYLTYPG